MSVQSPKRPRVSTSASHLPVPQSASPASSTEGGNTSPLLPPFQLVKPSLSRQSTMSIAPSQQHRTPFLTPRSVNANAAQSPHSLRLLMPTVRPARQSPHASPTYRMSPFKASPSRAGRSRAGSIAQSLQPSPDPSASSQVAVDWVGGRCRFEVVEDTLELEGYQLYAVEK